MIGISKHTEILNWNNTPEKLNHLLFNENGESSVGEGSNSFSRIQFIEHHQI